MVVSTTRNLNRVHIKRCHRFGDRLLHLQGSAVHDSSEKLTLRYFILMSIERNVGILPARFTYYNQKGKEMERRTQSQSWPSFQVQNSSRPYVLMISTPYNFLFNSSQSSEPSQISSSILTRNIRWQVEAGLGYGTTMGVSIL